MVTELPLLSRKLGGAIVHACGFAGGLWCLWKQSCPPIRVVSTSLSYIHLHIDMLSPSNYFFTIVYVSPHSY